MSTRFDLENAIMIAWQTENDLELLLRHYHDGELPMSTDDVANTILGLQMMHGIRMCNLWSVFKQVHNVDEFKPKTESLDESY